MATAAGYVGFFHLIPQYALFLDNERVSATFKDPNVYGPFLIFPLLLLIIGFMTRGIRITGLVIMAALLGGLFLSFSRGAWIHFIVSAGWPYRIGRRHARTRACARPVRAVRDRRRVSCRAARHRTDVDRFGARYVSQPRQGHTALRRRSGRPVLGAATGAWSDSRTSEWASAPLSSAASSAGQQHDVYMQGFLVYGWLGGAAYATLVLVTLVIPEQRFAPLYLLPLGDDYADRGLRAFCRRSRRRFYVDTDHCGGISFFCSA